MSCMEDLGEIDNINEQCEQSQELNIQYDNRKPQQLFEVPSNILFPSEFQQHLKQQIQYLSQENCLLKRNVHKLEAQLKHYEETAKEANENPTKNNDNEFLSPNEVTRTKIVELSKKLREKSSELMHYKNKCAKLDQTLAVIKLNEAEKLENLQVEEKPTERPSESELKLLNDKIASLNSKLFEEKNQVLRLKNDLKLATKLLQEEIGEGFESIQQITNNIHWKGRAVVINELQHKISDLKEKLKAYHDKEGNKSCEIASKKMYLEKKIDKLSKENDTLRTECENAMRKLESNRHKCKSLDLELSTWKQKYHNIADIYEKDRFSLTHITEQNTQTQNQLNDALKRKEKMIEKLQRENKELKLEMKRIECDIDNLNKMIKEKDAEIDCMKKSPEKILEEKFASNNLNMSQLNAERLRLLELTKVYNQRLQKERDQKINFELLFRNERQKAAKFEGLLARARLEDVDKASYTSLLSRTSSVDESLEFKLEIANEKIKALQTRLQIEKNERDMDLQEFSKILQNYK